MASSIAINQTQILAYIDIPILSNDLRLIILDYMHSRYISKIDINHQTYWLRLGLHLENKPNASPTDLDKNTLSFQIVLYNDMCNKMLSSFGTYCEEKAVYEYNSLKNNMPSDLDHVVFGGSIPPDEILFWCLYAFCPEDESTTMFRIRKHRHDDHFLLRAYVFGGTADGLKGGTEYLWKSWPHIKKHYDLKEATSHLICSHKLALSYGYKWKSNLDEYMNYSEIIRELFDGEKHDFYMTWL